MYVGLYTDFSKSFKKQSIIIEINPNINDHEKREERKHQTGTSTR